jgi:hypothetical protein
MSEEKTYTGGCHCGDVRYEATTDLKTVVSCNCSICSKGGTVLTFVPATSFKLVSGEENLTEYRFNKHRVAHLFCSKCGIRSFARGKNPQDGSDVVAINVRCLDDVDLTALPTKEFDGKSL